MSEPMKIEANAITTERINAQSITAERIRLNDGIGRQPPEEKPYRFVYREPTPPAPVVRHPTSAERAVAAYRSPPSPFAALAPLAPFALAFLPMMLDG